MALEGYKSNHNVVYSSKYHCVWTPKYRRAVLVGPSAKRCEQVLRQVADKYRAEIMALEIMPDHVHVLVEVDPQLGIHRLVKHLKGVSSHSLRQEFRTLKSRLPTLGDEQLFRVHRRGGAAGGHPTIWRKSEERINIGCGQTANSGKSCFRRWKCAASCTTMLSKSGARLGSCAAPAYLSPCNRRSCPPARKPTLRWARCIRRCCKMCCTV